MSQYTAKTVHEGGMRCRTNFEQSQVSISTDVGTTLGGLGKHPSPAQLLAASVASCMASMMAYLGARRNIQTAGITIESGYEEGKTGLTALNFHITVPVRISPGEKAVLEAAVKGCPVGAAIAPTVEKKISWTWAE